VKLRESLLEIRQRLEALRPAWWGLWSERLFPPQTIFARVIPAHTQILLFVGLTLLFTVLGSWIPPVHPIGFDWRTFWSINRIPPVYPPWTVEITRWLTWPLLVGLTLAAVCLAAIKRAVHPVSLIATILALPVLWVIFTGQIDGLIVLGFLGLPWLAPLVLLKPQASGLGLAARPSYLVAAALTAGVSILIWGWWPARVLSASGPYAGTGQPQDIALGWRGIPITLALIWASRGDLDMLMLAGVFSSPYLVPYHLLPFVPSVARLRPRAALSASVLSWSPFLANWWGDGAWWFAWLFVGYVWIGLAVHRYPHIRERWWGFWWRLCA